LDEGSNPSSSTLQMPIAEEGDWHFACKIKTILNEKIPLFNQKDKQIYEQY
jgi:hypothetical protein